MTPHQAYLCRLQQALSPLPPSLVEDIMNEIDWHFRAAAEAGRNEAEAASSLGDPASLGAAYRAASQGARA